MSKYIKSIKLPDGTSRDIKAPYIQDLNNGAVQFWSGTKAEYDAIETKDSNTIYNVTDDTSVSDIIANTDLSNLTELGEKRFSDITTTLTNKVDLSGSNAKFPYITATYVNGTSGYIIYSNGYCEQWGYSTYNSEGTTVSFLKTFINTNYNLCLEMYNSLGSSFFAVGLLCTDKTASTFTAHGWNVNTTRSYEGWWRACGYIS
jgi:hypothetical protein